MKMFKRSAVGFGLVVMLAFAGGLALLVVVGGVGQSQIEAWIGQRIKSVIAESLKPTLDFQSLDYQAPLTVVLNGVTMAADDPDNPGQRVNIIRARTLQLELAEIPSEGQPLKLASAYIDGAVFKLVQTQDGGLVGFSDMTESTDSAEVEQMLSEVLQIREVVIDDSSVIYDIRDPDIEPMHLNEIETVIRIDPGDGGTYDLNVMLERESVFDFSFKGALDLDDMALKIESAQLDAGLSREQDHLLPPQLQAVIKAYELTGAMTLSVSGTLDFDDIEQSDTKIALGLTEAYGIVGGYKLPIKSLKADGSLAGGLLRVDQLDADLLGGTVEGVGSLGLSEPRMMSVSLGGEGLVLQKMLPPNDEGKDSAVQGRVDLQVNARAPMADVTTKLAGSGEIKLTEGRIAELPIVSALITFMESRGEIDRLTGEATGTDEGHVVFEFRGDHAYLSTYDIDATWYAMRGRGKLFLDNRVAMNVNAGPLTKVSNTLGVVGRLVGEVTDRALVYRVRGTWGEMSVVPVPAGGLFGAPGDDESAEDFLNDEDGR